MQVLHASLMTCDTHEHLVYLISLCSKYRWKLEQLFQQAVYQDKEMEGEEEEEEEEDTYQVRIQLHHMYISVQLTLKPLAPSVWIIVIVHKTVIGLSVG